MVSRSAKMQSPARGYGGDVDLPEDRPHYRRPLFRGQILATALPIVKKKKNIPLSLYSGGSLSVLFLIFNGDD